MRRDDCLENTAAYVRLSSFHIKIQATKSNHVKDKTNLPYLSCYIEYTVFLYISIKYKTDKQLKIEICLLKYNDSLLFQTKQQLGVLQHIINIFLCWFLSELLSLLLVRQARNNTKTTWKHVTERLSRQNIRDWPLVRACGCFCASSQLLELVWTCFSEFRCVTQIGDGEKWRQMGEDWSCTRVSPSRPTNALLHSSQHTLRQLGVSNLWPFLHATATLSRLRTLQNPHQILTCPLDLCWARYGGTLLWGRREGWERNWKPNKTHNPKTLMSFQSRWPRSLSRLSQPKTTGGHETGKRNIFSNIKVPQSLSLRSPRRCLCLSSSSFSPSAFVSTKTTTIYLDTWKTGLFFPLPAAGGQLD